MHSFIPPHRFFPYLTWQDVQSLPQPSDIVLLQPIGAIEQHGFHLPLVVDAAIATGILGQALAKLPEDIPAYALPTLSYGKSNEHWHFPGTVTLSATTLLDTLMEVGSSLYRSGFRKLVFVNGHGGQPQIIEIAARDLRQQFKDFQVFPHFVWNVLAPEQYQRWLSPLELELGIHAGDAETSLMLALLPDWVKLDRARAEYPPRLSSAGQLSWEGRCPIAWMTRDISQSGTMGNPTTASKEKGLEMVEALSTAWAKLIQEIHEFQFPPSN